MSFTWWWHLIDIIGKLSLSLELLVQHRAEVADDFVVLLLLLLKCNESQRTLLFR